MHTFTQVYELDGSDLRVVKEVEKPSAFKCGSFGASSLVERRLATGNFAGQLQLWDLEHTNKPIFEVQAHASIVNQLDAFGGQVRYCMHLSRPALPRTAQMHAKVRVPSLQEVTPLHTYTYSIVCVCVCACVCVCVHTKSRGYGAPEVVTCGRDGCVRVWDIRQQDAPVAAFEPADSSNIRDCW